MKLLIHDLDEGDFKALLPETTGSMKVVSDDATIHSCVGCFGCWVKTPGACVIRDSYGDMGAWLARCDELMIISQCFYGGFSPFVKNVLDRSISYLHPYFVTRNGEMHHKRRYDNRLGLRVWFYGEELTGAERQTAEKLVRGNAVNLDCGVLEIRFAQGLEDMKRWITAAEAGV